MLTGHGFNKLPTWAETLLKGDVSGGTNPKLSNGDRLEAFNGNSYFDPRFGGVDSVLRLHGDEILHLSTKNQGQILISDSFGSGLPEAFNVNPIYQQVEIHNANIRGTLSFGNINANTNGSLVLWGGEYQQQRWGNFYMYGGTANLINPGIASQSANSTFTIKNNLGGDIVEFKQNIPSLGVGASSTIEMISGNSTISNTKQPTILRMNQSTWSGTTSIDRTFDILGRRFETTTTGVFDQYLGLEYNNLTPIKLYGDGSIETNTIQLTNGSTIKDINNNSFINLRSGSVDGRTSLSDVLYVDSIGSRVGIGVTPTTHKLQILGDGTENLLKIGVPSRDYYFNINSLGQSHFFTFGSSQGGVSIGGATSFTRLNNAVLSVFGNLSTASVASFGNASTIGSTINSPAGWRYTAGFTSFGDNTSENRGYVQPRNGTFTFYNAGLTTKGLTVVSNNDSNVFLGTRDATNIITNTKSTLHFEGKYWDSSASVVKASSISFDANLDGTSNITHSVDGTNVIVLKSNGVLNYSNYPTSPTGLVAGDIWSDGGKLTVI